MSTLDDLKTNPTGKVVFSAVIEGFPPIITSGDVSAVFAAFDSSDYPGYQGRDVVGGLSIDWDQEQRVSPFEPFPSPSLVKFAVAPAVYDGAESDIVGETVFKRSGGVETGLAAAVDCDDTAMTVLSADDFASSGRLYVGPETMFYSSRDTGTDEFTISVRGYAAAFHTQAGDRFARTHKPLTSTEVDIGIPPVVSSEPRTWVGRQVAIWIHSVSGSEVASPHPDGSGAHLAFAGQLVSVTDADGLTVFEAEDVRRSIYGTRLNRDPWRARIGSGHELTAGDQFTVATTRVTTTGIGDPLVVVASGASGANQIDAGTYTVEELGSAINTWLQAERVASRILFNLSYRPLVDTSDGTRGALDVRDPGGSVGNRREVEIGGTGTAFHVLGALGWNGTAIYVGHNANGTAYTARAPLRISIGTSGATLRTLPCAGASGTWVSQMALLPVDLRDVTQAVDGVVRIGDQYLRAKYVSDTEIHVSGAGLERFGPDGAVRGVEVEWDEEAPEVRQVLVVEAPFADFLLRVLLSTGTAGFNHPSFDTNADTLGCGIPYQILGDDFVADVQQLACADTPLSALIDGPVSFHELFKADFVLRRCFLVWGEGRLQIRSWATPTSAFATVSIGEDTKASPTGTADNGRASITESAEFYNLVTIRYNIDAAGQYRDSLTLRDATSIREHGERGIEVRARNSFRAVNAVGSPLDELVSLFAGFFGYTSRPWYVITRTMDQNLFERTTPGTVVSLTDRYIRSPATGLRYSHVTGTGGLSGVPAMVIGQEYSWGGVDVGRGGRANVSGPAGQVWMMISPRRTIAPYVPTAQVDEGEANGGYDAGSKTLTCHAHEHSESGEAADASHFPVGSIVRVLEIDPDDPTSPLTWDDEVTAQSGNTITLDTGLSGWDSGKLYRVIFADFGDVVTAQQANCYQADDADGLIEDVAQAYAWGFFGSSQSRQVTLSTATEPPARYATISAGDGRPMDTGATRDAVRLVNNLINYKTAWQSPTSYTEARAFTGAGTWQLVECQPIFLGMGLFTAGYSRLMTLSPHMRSTTGATANLRITISSRRPSGATRDDVTRIPAYVSATYATASVALVVPTAQTIDIAHVRRGDITMGGVAWLYVEISTATEYYGLARARLGPLAL